METFFIVGFGILISFILICIAQYLGKDLGTAVGEGLYGTTPDENED